ncbi:MAG: hypothetical protein AB7G13_35450 [Lautropia sp.]
MTPAIGRVLLTVVVLVVGLLAARGLAGGWPGESARESARDQYRPKRRTRRAGAGEVPARGARAVIRRSALAQLRDALTGGPLDADGELFRCADCQSFYNVASVRALANDNGARCIQCRSIHRIDVEVVDG